MLSYYYSHNTNIKSSLSTVSKRARARISSPHQKSELLHSISGINPIPPKMPNKRLFVASLAATATAIYINGSVVAPCDSPIYCHGQILKEIELARPFADSKTFVDMYVPPFQLTQLN